MMLLSQRADSKCGRGLPADVLRTTKDSCQQAMSQHASTLGPFFGRMCMQTLPLCQVTIATRLVYSWLAEGLPG